MSRWLLLALCLAGGAGRLQADIIPHFSGNHRAVAEANSEADSSVSFAVFERSGVADDVFGTGVTGFDDDFIPAANSQALDTTAQYLYLYQVVNDGNGDEMFDRAEIPAASITSLGFWNLGFRDGQVDVEAGNPLGRNVSSFRPAAPPVLGVGTVTLGDTSENGDPPPSLTYPDGTVVAQYTLNQGRKTAVFGFTSNAPPVVREVTLASCEDDMACGSFVSPLQPGEQHPQQAFFPVNPRATYLRTADEQNPGPEPATIVELAKAIPGNPVAAGDLLLLQRVGNFRFVIGTPAGFEGPHGDFTLRNLWGVFSSSDELLPDDPMKPAPVFPVRRVSGARPVLEGTAVPINTDADPINMSVSQPTNISQDFVVDIEGDLVNPDPVLVRVPVGATHLFLGAGDIQFFDNDYAALEEFGVRIAVVEPGRLQGDYAGNGVVDGSDFLSWQRQFGSVGIARSADGDLNARVTGNDLRIWRTNFGRVVAGQAASTATPEPSTAVLALLALAATCAELKKPNARLRDRA